MSSLASFHRITKMVQDSESSKRNSIFKAQDSNESRYFKDKSNNSPQTTNISNSISNEYLFSKESDCENSGFPEGAICSTYPSCPNLFTF